MGTAPKTSKASDALPLAVKLGDVVLDRYRIVEQIASGGHSVVFRGTDERLSRPVCVKVFSGLGGNSGVGRTSYEHFVQEAFALSRLTHPNTLRIYDFGHLGPKDADGMPLQVCEFMNGGTLSNLIREQGKQSLADTTRITQAMCLSLSEAHGLGIVHRDIKPQNILFGTVGGARLPKLADFGIAKWSADDDNKQQRAEDTQIVAGQKLAMYSPSWAAPEQLAGQPVSPSTDIYSLACVAVYMLSGKAIFADEDVYAGYKKRRHAEELVGEALRPLGIEPSTIQLLAKALAFDPKKRLIKVEELADGLAAAIAPGVEPPRREDAERPRAKPSASIPPIPRRASATVPPPLPPAPTPPAPTPPAAAVPLVPTPLPAQSLPAPMLARPAAEPTPPPQPHGAPPLAPPPPQPMIAAPAPAAPTHMPAQSQSWAPPPIVQPWMHSAPNPQGLPRRLMLADVPQPVADRRVSFLHATSFVADLVGGRNKVRITFLSGPGGGRVIHLKGLTCFVAHLGGRPSPAVQLEHASDLSLVTPRAQEIGHIRVATGSPGVGQIIFPIGNELVGLAADDCMDPILFDFGPGSDAYFVYTQGRPVPKSRRA